MKIQITIVILETKIKRKQHTLKKDIIQTHF